MRLTLLKNTLVWAMVSGLLLSPQLWLTERTYPHAPVIAGLGQIPAPWDGWYFALLLALLAVIVIVNRPHVLILTFVGLAAVLALLDQTRWQPWVYQYLFMFAAIGLGCWGGPDREEAALNACRLIVAATYFWSGLQKFNFSFADDTFRWLMRPVLEFVDADVQKLILEQGWTAALVEFGIGLGLLVWPLRPLAAVLAVAMHALILFSLWSHGWNTIVWPWNVAMMAFVLILFVKTRRVTPLQIVWPQRFMPARLTLLLFGVLPLLSFFELWDAYLSAALYSGNTPHARMTISAPMFAGLPAAAQRFVHGPNLENAYEVDITTWAFDELNVPPYPAPRVFRQIARALAARGEGELVLVIEGRRAWRTGEFAETREVIHGTQ